MHGFLSTISCTAELQKQELSPIHLTHFHYIYNGHYISLHTQPYPYCSKKVVYRGLQAHSVSLWKFRCAVALLIAFIKASWLILIAAL